MKFTAIVFCLIAATTAFAATDSRNSDESSYNVKDGEQKRAPYIVQMFKDTLCGCEEFIGDGALLNSRFVLTVAHSVVFGINDLTLVAGRHQSRVSESWEQRRRIEMFIFHNNFTLRCHNYDDCSTENDIVLLYVNQPFDFNNYVQPIQLPESQQIPTGAVQIFSWNGKPELQTMEISLFTVSLCQQHETIDSTNLCASPMHGGAHNCDYFAGDPLVQFDEKNQPILIGMVNRCRPALLFVRVSAFLAWIHTRLSEVSTFEH